ncbi:MAG: hypothetical protein IJU31_01695, partial [Synergistaceae bacterium]|nr:hypothetical protein [Synergistaceae bacterium]
VVEEVDEPEATPLTPDPSPLTDEEAAYVDEVADDDEVDSTLLTDDEGLPDIPLIEDESVLPDIPVIGVNDSEEFEVEDVEEETPAESFSPNADIVLNVAEEFPEPQEPAPDPEGESVPVSVTMPETTKTAEDKLMADIAEAMTGNPLTLETRETPEPYNLPEKFLNEASSADPSHQSAEEKLIANIAQAMSESPLDAARNNAAQDFEQELNNLTDFIETPFPNREELLTEEVNISDYEEDEPEPAPELQHNDEPEKPETEIEATFEESPLPDPVPEPDPEPAEESGVVEEEPEPEIIPESGTVEEPEIFETVAEEPKEEDPLTHDPSPLTEEITEVEEKQDMPEQSLLIDETENKFEDVGSELSPESSFEDEDAGDDFDISSLGAISEAASMPDFDEPAEDIAQEPVELPPVAEPAYSYQDEYEEDLTPPPDTKLDEGEERDIEKVMTIREKMAGRKGNMPKDSEGTKGKAKKKLMPSFSGGFLMPLMLVGLLCVGGFIAWQLMQLNNRLAMNAGFSGMSYDSGPVETNPSYEYAIDFIFDTSLAGRMAQRGKDGWQVVGSRRTQDSITGQLGYEFIFMRKTPVK